MLPAAAPRLIVLRERDFDLGSAEFIHFSLASRVASSPALICRSTSAEETEGCANRKARIWSGLVIMGEEYALPRAAGKGGGGFVQGCGGHGWREKFRCLVADAAILCRWIVKLIFALLFALPVIRTHAAENTPADFSIGTQVVNPAPQRFGLNVLDPLTNNHLRDSGSEPVSIRRHMVATGGSDTTILVQGGASDLDYFTTLGNGFFNGATVRVYRSVAGVMVTVRTGTVQTYDVTTGTLTFTAAGAVVQNGDLFFVELLHAASPPFALFDPRITNIVYNTWRHMNGENTSATSLAQPAITRDVTTACPENGGRTSLRIENTLSNRVGIRQGRWANPDPRTSSTQGFYQALVPGRTYRIDVWLKHSGLAVPTVSARLTQNYALERAWTVTTDWAKYTATFVAGAVPVGGNVVEAELGFSGTGVVWMDNFQIYADDDLNAATDGPDEIRAETRAALIDFQPSVLRFWAGNTNSSWGTTLDAFTQRDSQLPPRWIPDRGYGPPEFGVTLPTALPLSVECGAQPWLVIGHTFDESEWLGLIEYLAAPYDPLIDTPATKPWAARRHAQGRAAPWMDAFSKVRLEMSNEMWNTVFHQAMPAVTAGQFAQHMFAAAQTSPYFAAVAGKIEFIINGRILEGATTGYGHVAWQNAPAALFSDVATYNGGWELAQQTGGGVFNETGLGEFLQFAGRFANPWMEAHAASRASLRASTSRPYEIAVYETGPGYGLPNPGAVFNEVSELYGKSLAAGTGTLDILLYSSLRGFDPQCFFTLSYGPNWSTHSHTIFGGLPHTAWQTLRMRNRYATGSMMNVIAHSLPTTTLPATGGGFVPSVANFPLTTCFAFRDGGKTTIFLCSRKSSGDTPVTLRLPFSAVSSITQHRLDGAPGDNNRYTQTVTESTTALTPATMLNLTLPPGTVIALEVEGTPLSAPAQPACVVSKAVGQDAVTSAPAARFAVDFSDTVTGFTAADCTITGSTGAGELSVAQGVPFLGGNYVVTVSGMLTAGDVSIAIAANTVLPSNTASTSIDGTVTFAPAPPQNVIYASESFDFAPAAQPFPPFLQDLVSGTGWSAGWVVEGASPIYPANGYRTLTTVPLGFGQLRATGSSATGGNNSSDIVRALNVASFGTRGIVGSSPAVIGQSGTVLWLSVLLRKDVNNTTGIYLAHLNGGATAPMANGVMALGYFSSGLSDVNGERRWSFSVRNAADNGFDIIRSNVPVVIGQAALLVFRMQFGAQDRFDLWVNPPALAGADPALGTANATWTTSGATNIAFRSIGVEISGAQDRASFDEVRYGETFAAVTPVWSASESWRLAHFGTHENLALAADDADPDLDGIVNLLEYALASNPHASSTGDLPTLALDGTFGYAPNPLATDISIVPQWSEDLVQWFNTTPPTGLPRRFQRLRVTRQ